LPQKKLSGKKIPSSAWYFQRAEDEIRTRDPDLGKVVLYQLSYFRMNCKELKECKDKKIADEKKYFYRL
jgi:hypothetical protein